MHSTADDDRRRTRRAGALATTPTRESARAYVERQLGVSPADGISFEQLRNDAPGTYEELKDAVFELLSSSKAAQRYDHLERKMKLVGVP